jgi:hypothetical protein
MGRGEAGALVTRVRQGTRDSRGRTPYQLPRKSLPSKALRFLSVGRTVDWESKLRCKRWGAQRRSSVQLGAKDVL